MRWLVYGDLAEEHVVDSFCDALIQRGVEVIRLAALTRSHQFITNIDAQQQIQRNLESVISEHKIDVMFNFRAAELNLRHLELLKSKGIFSLVWFPDDPLLYQICYRHIVDFYDIILHCGNTNVIQFYQERHEIQNGFCFPFWTSEKYFPYCYNKDIAEYDIGFLGNCHTVNRKGRYELIASLPFKKTFFGQPPQLGDYCGIWSGYIKNAHEIPRHLQKLKLGLSLPQFFSDAKDTIYSFPELDLFESFYFPSRIVQYASCGIPIIIKNSQYAQNIFSSILIYKSRAELIDVVQQLLAYPDQLAELSKAVNLDFQNYLSATSRVDMLLALIKNKTLYSLEDRVNLWRNFPPSNLNNDFTFVRKVTVNEKSDLLGVNEQKEVYKNNSFISEHVYKILFIGKYYFGKTDIVYRLRKSLENLGHNVFELNCDLFDQVINNPEKLCGGFGPIEIKLEKILPIINQFQPQIIVCCAGGYTFSNDDSLLLKRRGIILIGIALSDPDVFESEKIFAGRFDYHTTNAKLSIEQYKKHGLTNTIYFPFAIDQSFIENDIVAAPDYMADIICIGHAQGRPERIELMQELARHFNVRTYGEGWPFPNSEAIYDEDFFKAAKAGKFHINFPVTRANFVNVKIGVFEAIACGGIICTPYFDEMRNFFNYETEIIGYHNSKDLIAKLRYFLDHPEEAEKIRRAGYARLLQEHTWEQRWNALFTEIEYDLYIRQQILPQGRYAQINLCDLVKPVRIVVSGFYGANNTGDELILSSLIQNFSRKYPNLHLTVCTNNVVNTTLTHGVAAVLRTDLYGNELLIQQADLFILGGGGLFHDYSFNVSGGIPDFFNDFTHSITGYGTLPTMAKIHGTPVMFFSLGIGPLNNPDAKKMIKFLCDQADIITVRDYDSEVLLNALPAYSKKTILVADPTFLLELPELNKDDLIKHFQDLKIEANQAVGVSLRNWFDFPLYLQQRFAELLDWIIEEFNLTIIFIPFQFLKSGHDRDIQQKIGALMRNKQHIYSYENTGDYVELLQLLSQVKIMLSMRLHGSILANLMGTPAIGFSYDPKIQAHFKEMECEQLLMPLEFDLDVAKKQFAALINNYSGYKNHLVTRVSLLKARATHAFELAFELIDKGMHKQKTRAIQYPLRISTRTKLLQYKNKLTALEADYEALLMKFRFLDKKWLALSYPGLHFSAMGNAETLCTNWSFEKNNDKCTISITEPNYLLVNCKMSATDKLYIVSSPSGFSQPPLNADSWRLQSNTQFKIMVKINFISGNPAVELWMIEYNDQERLTHSTFRLAHGKNEFMFISTPKTICFKLAFRLTLEGEVGIMPAQIFKMENYPITV